MAHTRMFYHVTTRDRLASILRHGLQVQYANPQSKLKAVWLHSARHTPSIILHTLVRHKANLDEVVIVPVTVTMRTLTRFANSTWRKGIYYSKTDIPVGRLGTPVCATAYTLSLFVSLQHLTEMDD